MGGSDGFTFLPGVVEDVCVMETWNPEKAASWNQAPKLHYCLEYDQQKAELFVTHLEGMLSVDSQGLLGVCLPWRSCAGGMGAPEAGGIPGCQVSTLCQADPETCSDTQGFFLSLSYNSSKWRFQVGGHLSSKW